MTKEEEIEQSWKLFEELCRQRKERLDKLERDINDVGTRYGISTGNDTNNTTDSLLPDSDSDGIRPHQVGAEAVQEGGSQQANQEFAEEER